MQETQESWVWTLGQEDPLEEEMGTQSSILAWKLHGQRSLVDYSPKGGREADRTEQLNTGTHNKYAVEDFSIIIENAREFQKNMCFIDFAKAFDCVEYYKLWEILQEMAIPDHLTCLLRNLYAGQQATVKTGHGTTDWFQIRKGVCQGCILSPCLFNLYAEYILLNARLDEAQVGIKISERNINNLGYADDTTLMAESEEELKSLLMKMKKESEKLA